MVRKIPLGKIRVSQKAIKGEIRLLVMLAKKHKLALKPGIPSAIYNKTASEFFAQKKELARLIGKRKVAKILKMPEYGFD